MLHRWFGSELRWIHLISRPFGRKPLRHSCFAHSAHCVCVCLLLSERVSISRAEKQIEHALFALDSYTRTPENVCDQTTHRFTRNWFGFNADSLAKDPFIYLVSLTPIQLIRILLDFLTASHTHTIGSRTFGIHIVSIWINKQREHWIGQTI